MVSGDAGGGVNVVFDGTDCLAALMDSFLLQQQKKIKAQCGTRDKSNEV